MKVGIVGAGIAGLACAEALASEGLTPILFDKGRRPGGRLSTLRLGDMAWDFGTQYFTQGNRDFARAVAAWKREGLISSWPAGPAGALVGTPAMSSLIEVLGVPYAVRHDMQVQQIERDGDDWYVSGTFGREGPFGAMVVATPAEQAAPLLSLHDLVMAREAATVRSQPCWTLMLAFAEPLTHLPAVLRDHGDISWACRNNSKPGRPATECWVIQASGDWSRQHLEMDRSEVAGALLARFEQLTGTPLPEPVFAKAHRWRFAQPAGTESGCLWNPRLRLGACGDWRCGPGVEAAWRSGKKLGETIAQQAC